MGHPKTETPSLLRNRRRFVGGLVFFVANVNDDPGDPQPAHA